MLSVLLCTMSSSGVICVSSFRLTVELSDLTEVPDCQVDCRVLSVVSKAQLDEPVSELFSHLRLGRTYGEQP